MMGQVSTTAFEPPTPERFAAYLEENPPRIPSPWRMWAPLGMVVLAAVLGYALGGWAALVLPWVAIGGLFIYLTTRLRTARSLDAQTTQAQELAMLRHYPQALRRGWRLLPRVAANPLLHARLVALMAHCLDEVKSFDAAMVGYDYLLANLPEEHAGAVQLRIQRATAALGADHLADADDHLRRLRGRFEPADQTSTAASYRLAQLIQQVRTNHFADAIEHSDGLIEKLRPLGVEAGYGHALMALCHYHRRDDDPTAARQAVRTWWDRATLVLPASALVDRFPELAPLRSLDGPADVNSSDDLVV